MTDSHTDKFPASTSYNEQIPGGASLARDLVSLPQPPAGGPAMRELSFGELWKEVVSDPGASRRARGGVAWRRGVAVPRDF